MLEGLDAIDWSALTHAYGPAEDVPAMLRKRTSDDPADWVAAIDSLYWTIYHQRTVYDSTPQAVPFLIELLEYREVKCRGRILELLAAIARGSSYLDAHKDLSSFREERETEEFREQLERELETVRATRAAVWRGWKTYLEAGSNLDRRIRITAPYLLAALSWTPLEEFDEAILADNPHVRIIRSLRRWLDEEPSELIRASLVFSLADRSRRDASCLEAIRGLLHDADDSLTPVRVSAALVLAQREDPPQAALDVLARVLGDADRYRDLFSSGEPSIEERHNPLMQAYSKAGHPLVETVDESYQGQDAGAGPQ